METVNLVCSHKPRPSVQNNHSKGNQWWKRDTFHVDGGNGRTLCGVDCREWLSMDDPRPTAAAAIDPDLCKRCAAKLNH